MDKEDIKQVEARVKRRLGFLMLGVGLIGLISLSAFLLYTNRKTPVEPVEESHPAQDAYVRQDKYYPTQHIGFQNQFWEYVVVDPETEFIERQEILDEGLLTLWPRFTEEDVLWIAGHHPGTFTLLAENINIGSRVEVTTPSMYQGRYPTDSPDVLRYEIVERVVTDVWAGESFETLGMTAGDIYNYGADDHWLVLQHSGETDEEVVLYLGQFIEKEEGEYISNVSKPQNQEDN